MQGRMQDGCRTDIVRLEDRISQQELF